MVGNGTSGVKKGLPLDLAAICLPCNVWFNRFHTHGIHVIVRNGTDVLVCQVGEGVSELMEKDHLTLWVIDGGGAIVEANTTPAISFRIDQNHDRIIGNLSRHSMHDMVVFEQQIAIEVKNVVGRIQCGRFERPLARFVGPGFGRSTKYASDIEALFLVSIGPRGKHKSVIRCASALNFCCSSAL